MNAALGDFLASGSSFPSRFNSTIGADVAQTIREARAVQPSWAASPLRHRLKVLRRFRHRLAARPEDFTSAIALPQRRSEAESLAAELLPLADACKWLEHEGPRLLAPKRLSNRHRPAWLTGVRVTEHRDPLGVVLIIGTWNYPLMLPGIQAAQALAAGNAVLLKPGRNSESAASALRDSLVASGLDPRLLSVVSESTDAADAAIDAGVDKVVLTGSATTGRAVLTKLAATLTPAVMELSGCDAVFVRGDADLDLVVRALVLGATFNGSATCVAPRRVFVHRPVARELQNLLVKAFASLTAVPVTPETADRLNELLRDATRRGARQLSGSIERSDQTTSVRPILLGDASPEAELLKEDFFAPVLSLVPVHSDEEALQYDRHCPYALGAAVFGRSEGATELATKIDAGCVVVNDLIVPTADPRVAFGGRRQSGFGVTRGAGGLLEMTQPKTVVERTGSWLPHLDPPSTSDQKILTNLLAATHGRNWRTRLRAGCRLIGEAYRRQR